MLSFAEVAQDASKPAPNVLLVLTDDQGWGDVRSHGNDQIDTPVMDRIAAEGARFDGFFVSPLCAPTRAALLTGRDHMRTGATWVTHRREVMRAEEYEQWFAQASQGAQHRPPIPVGYAEADTVEITSAEAHLVGDLHFANGPGWTTDWMTGWGKTQDCVWWDLNVVCSGGYRVLLKFACPEQDAGAKLQVRVVGGGDIERILDRPFDEGLRVRPDRTSAKRTMREFTELELGELEVPEGRVKLELRALTKPGRTVCELRGLVLRRIE